MRFCPRRHISVSSLRVAHRVAWARNNALICWLYRAELDYLAVHPDSQGRGIATQLVESGLKEAKKIGLDVYVRAFPPGVGLYRRLGFRIEKELLVDESEEGGPGEVYRALMTYAIAS